MKKIFIVILSTTGFLHAAPGVAIRGMATAESQTLTLDLFADTEAGDQLRSFGLLVEFDPGVLKVRTLARYETLWFLSPDGGTTTEDYAVPTSSEKGSLELLGLRFDGTAPTTGVTGESLLLASVVFDLVKEGDPGFEFSLARPEPFVNFALADGTSLDDNVSGLGNLTDVTNLDPVEDEDKDGLPDSYEKTVFGSTDVSKGTGDFDHDGQSDLHEWLAGTDPKDRNSFLKLDFTMRDDGSKLFRWDGIAGRIYRLMRSDDLTTKSLVPVIGTLPGRPGLEVEEPANDAPRAFYVLKVENSKAR